MTSVRTPSGLQAVKAVYVRTASGLQQLSALYIRDASNTLRSVLATLKASVNTTFVTGSGYSRGSITIATSNCTVTAGGTGPFTYAWTKLSGDANWSATQPGAFSTAFRRTTVNAGGDYSSTWQCTVTDANGKTVTTPTVTANVINQYSF